MTADRTPNPATHTAEGFRKFRFGAGGEARRPLGIAVVGGLVFSQFLTLYITPTFYVSMARMEAALKGRRTRHT